MRLAQWLLAPVVAVLLLLGVTSPGYAAHPKAGATYTGVNSASDHVTLTMNKAGTKVSGKVKDSCGTITRFAAERVKASGKFSLVWNNQFGQPSYFLKGTFVSPRKAKGTVNSVVVCEGDATRPYVALLAS